MSKKDYLVKKAKQAARRAARDRVDNLTPPEKKKSFFIFVKVSARTKQFVKEGAKKYGTMKKYFLSLLQKDGYNLDVNDQ